jgi:hypothetical protein
MNLAYIVGMNDPSGRDPLAFENVYGSGVASRDEWRASFVRVNLCPGRKWRPLTARTRVEEFVRTIPEWSDVALLGRDVWRAFDFPIGHEPFSMPILFMKRYFHRVPHPSGRSLWYNEPAKKDRVRVFFRELAEGARPR